MKKEGKEWYEAESKEKKKIFEEKDSNFERKKKQNLSEEYQKGGKIEGNVGEQVKEEQKGKNNKNKNRKTKSKKDRKTRQNKEREKGKMNEKKDKKGTEKKEKEEIGDKL